MDALRWRLAPTRPHQRFTGGAMREAYEFFSAWLIFKGVSDDLAKRQQNLAQLWCSLSACVLCWESAAAPHGSEMPFHSMREASGSASSSSTSHRADRHCVSTAPVRRIFFVPGLGSK
ncbi:hypothetical protein SPI_01377 [Niveomyces insectorum RCEF 264]|uniref:Uncharacterized protein n=1 Tax=Niveomyces insectorum RCEF 264 TaxID=1081102 RepID=A0A167YX53_9HYPO|nr:hypothetical protein SPI_01377 [Niveomyces insectorum RCEF 264]